MSNELIIAITFLLLLGLILIKCPIFISLGLAGFIGIYLCAGVTGLMQAPFSIMQQLHNFVLVAVPLYILMGEVLFITGIGEELFEVANKWFGNIPGGLAMASIFAAAIFGAMSGISIAGVAVIGVMAVPEMLKRKYNKSLAAGAVASSGALAMLIPPSLLFILYAAVSEVPVNKLFIGGIVPGLFLVIAMMSYVYVSVIRNPDLAPRMKEKVAWKERFFVLKRLWTALLLILAVLGTIYTGVCTATEAAAVGALGSFLIAIFIYKTLRWRSLRQILAATSRTTAAVLLIAACAFIFSQFIVYTRVPDLVAHFCLSLQWSPVWIVILIMVIFIIVGMFVDGGTLILVTTPIILPTIIALGYDPLWYGIVIVLKTEMAVIMPPIGLNLYTLKSIVPDLNMSEIMRGVLPYIALEFIVLLIFIFIPQLALWLPGQMK